MTPHIEASKDEIAKIVIMPGDPLRAKYIAEKYLDDYKLVNQVRNMLAYTGKYKGKELTVMGSGMGMSSMGIYAFELFKFYDVDTIIRVGTCGTYKKEIDLLDTILVRKSFTVRPEKFTAEANKELNEIIKRKAKEENIELKEEDIACVEYFDPYVGDVELLLSLLPQGEDIAGSEMESYPLFALAERFNKKAACLLTVVDSVVKKESLTSEDREKSVDNMIKIALNASLEI